MDVLDTRAARVRSRAAAADRCNFSRLIMEFSLQTICSLFSRLPALFFALVAAKYCSVSIFY